MEYIWKMKNIKKYQNISKDEQTDIVCPFLLRRRRDYRTSLLSSSDAPKKNWLNDEKGQRKWIEKNEKFATIHTL